MRFINRLTIIAISALYMLSANSYAGQERLTAVKVILDDDWDIDSGGFVVEPFITPYFDKSKFSLLGLTSVTGDNWKKEGELSLLRFLELTNHSDIKLYSGEQYPLVKTYFSDLKWQHKNGARVWNGAWNTTEMQKNVHPNTPENSITPVWGMPTKKIESLSAVDFLIQTARDYPGEITIVSDGPLTNLAKAIKKDPLFIENIKQIVVFSTNILKNTNGYLDEAPFNEYFDPESASIVIESAWKKIVLAVPDNDIPLDESFLSEITNKNDFIYQYMLKSGAKGLPAWPIISAPYFSRESEVDAFIKYVSINTDANNKNYGNLIATDVPIQGKNQKPLKIKIINSKISKQKWLQSL